MEGVVDRHDKSTNVRTMREGARTAPGAVRLAFRILSATAPSLAVSLGEVLFRSPPRMPHAGARERAVLAAGTAFDVDVDGERLAAWRWGEGPPVLLAHGWGGRAGQLHGLVGPLVEAGFSVFAWDAPAHGASGGWLASMPQFARAMVRMGRDAGPVHAVVGHSFGGAAIGLAFARGLQARRAVMFAPPAAALPWLRTFARAVALPARVEEALQRRLEARVGVPFEHLTAQRLAGAVHAPLLVVHDRDDRETPWADGAAVARAAPRGELVTTEGLGHRRLLRDPAVIARVVEFVAAGASGSGRAGRDGAAQRPARASRRA